MLNVLKYIFAKWNCTVAILLSVATVQAQTDSVSNRFGMHFILVKPGSMVVGKFQPTVGNASQDVPLAMYAKAVKMAKAAARPGFSITIARPFYLGKFEVTQHQWMQVMGSNPSTFNNDSSLQQPVENISWGDAEAFIDKLNTLDTLHYYRLPTEFEWEYAARAGNQDDIPWKQIQATAVLGGKSPKPVGARQPNAWGFYDMLGNVWEWVQDIYNEKIFADKIPPRKGGQHVLKGASFTGDVKNATYMTHAAGPGNGFDVGFRLVMEMRN